MYLHNKYTSVYNSIIERAKSRDLPKEIYTENHHIIPRSLGGGNSKNNLVRLTAREHRLCHLLLPKMTISEDYTRKMWYAAWMILRVENSGQHRRISKGKFYELAKIEFTKLMSKLHKGKNVSAETRKKQSDARKGKPGPNKGKPMSVEQKLKLSMIKKGTYQSPEVIARQVASRKGYKHSEEAKKKISESQIGKTKPPISQEHKDAISKKMKNRVMSEETKRKMSESRKAYWDAKRASNY